MQPFDFQLRTRIVFGPNKVDALGELAAQLGVSRVLIVSDPGIIAAGHVARGQAALERSGLVCELFADLSENPTTAMLTPESHSPGDFEPELIVGLGGGSSMDCAKGINFLFSNGGRMQDYWGVGKAKQPMLPMFAAPTTAGTGSETQSFALISDEVTHVKMACGDKKAAFHTALLDPTLTLSQPRRVTALTGVDALAHAVETYVTRLRNPMSLAYSREAWLLLAENFSRVLDDPRDLEARSAMQLGAMFSGLAIENSMLGRDPRASEPADGQLWRCARPGDWDHVAACDSLQWRTVRRLVSRPARRQRRIARLSNRGIGRLGLSGFSSWTGGEADLPDRLSNCGVAREKLPQMADEAAQQWTGTFNPRPVDAAALLSLYEAAY